MKRKKTRFGRQGVWLNHLTTTTSFLHPSLSFFTQFHFFFLILKKPKSSTSKFCFFTIKIQVIFFKAFSRFSKPFPSFNFLSLPLFLFFSLTAFAFLSPHLPPLNFRSRRKPLISPAHSLRILPANPKIRIH